IEVNQTINIEYNPERIFNKPANQLAFFEKQNPAELNINYRHIENAFDDFEEEILLPQKQTAFGPALAVADVNNDGLDDFFAGGGKGQSGLLYLQQGNGSFVPAESQPWEIDAMSEDVDAVFIDPNQDGNMDLLVLSGGSGDFVNEKHFLIDRFYANLGTGRFGKIGNILPDLQSASYSVIAENIDKDPENELLVLGAAKPGNYPLSEKIILYDYFDNKYNDVTEELAVALLEEKGLTRDAVWIDLNNDNAKDLITVGEWQTINVYINKNGKLYKKTSDWGIEDKEGWWRSIDKSDLDNDGDLDFVVGNVGINFKQKAKKDYPLYLNSSDFNENGTLDIVLAKNNNNKIIPARGRQSSSEQMPFTKDKFETYNAFASSSVNDILGDDKIDSGVKLKAIDFHSYIIWNVGDRFEFEALPVLAQAFPVNDIAFTDINSDNIMDMILVGNDYNTEYETPRLDAGNGLAVINNGKGNMKSLTIRESGIYCPGDTKKIKILDKGNENQKFLIANNNASLEILK
ncbi:MAG: VCBS repeat-containing protein, partial [Bacteroidia bacterium]|nr:VCBS repeat-containing protein [Bacteroidia bacterium]